MTWVAVQETRDRNKVGGDVDIKPPTTAFSGFVFMIAPVVTCWTFIIIYLWLLVVWPSWGFDPAWQCVVALLVVLAPGWALSMIYAKKRGC